MEGYHADEDHDPPRRLGRASPPLRALAAPALALSGAGPDPIFAAIENHRKSDAESLRLADLEDDLPPSKRTPELVAALDAAVDIAR
jgi:hypothetical protein